MTREQLADQVGLTARHIAALERGERRPTLNTMEKLLRTLGAQSGADTGGVMIRAVGVAIVAEFGAQLCRDAGEGALAGRVEMAGRVTMLTLALPLLTDLVTRLSAMMP